MSETGPLERARRNVTGITSIVVTGIWLAALFTDQGWWLAALLVGYVVVVPLVAILFGDDEDRAEWVDDWREESESESEGEDESALERLRRRYADGELTDEQFERKLERLLETETIEDAEKRTREAERESN